MVMMMVWTSWDNFPGTNDLVRRDDDLGMDDLRVNDVVMDGLVVGGRVVDCLVVSFVGDGFVVNSFVMCGCNFVVNSWNNHSFVVLDDCLFGYRFVNYFSDGNSWFFNDVNGFGCSSVCNGDWFLNDDLGFLVDYNNRGLYMFLWRQFVEKLVDHFLCNFLCSFLRCEDFHDFLGCFMCFVCFVMHWRLNDSFGDDSLFHCFWSWFN